jgi:hypothetical protein
MTTFLRISGRDPLVARDGRPFGAGQGNRMRSSGWLYPSVVAGSFRTTLGKVAGREFDLQTQNDLLEIDVAGVFPLVDDHQLYLSFRRYQGVSSGQKCPVLQGLDEFAQLRLGG